MHISLREQSKPWPSSSREVSRDFSRDAMEANSKNIRPKTLQKQFKQSKHTSTYVRDTSIS